MNIFTPAFSLKRIWIFLCFVFISSVSVFTALAAGASEPLSGEGGEELSGYSVGDQTYVLNEDDPTKINSVEFSLGGSVSPGFVTIRLEEDGPWYRCELRSSGSQLRVSCDTRQGGSLSVADVTALRVVAAGN